LTDSPKSDVERSGEAERLQFNVAPECRESTQNERWSMLVPKSKPGTRRAATPVPHRRPTGLISATSKDDRDGLPASPSRAHIRFSRGYASDGRVIDPWRAVRFILSLVAAVLAISFWALARFGPQLTGTTASFSMPSGQSWIRQQVPSSARTKSSKNLILYRPSVPTSSYRMEFDWKVQAGGIGCILRAQDPRNYHAAKLRAVPGGFAAEHFSVIDGVESEHVKRMVAFSRRDPEVAVTIEAMGPIFTLYLADELVDTWRDERLSAGAPGFVEERSEKVPARNIRLVFLNASSRQDAESILKDGVEAAQRWWASLRARLVL